MKLKWIHTSDVHGSFLSENGMSGLDSVASYVDALRKEWGDSLLLSDGGDCLLGSPYTYYYNSIAQEGQHGVAQLMNAMRYDVGCVGNHDIEAGDAVRTRFFNYCNFPVVCANVIDESSGKSAFLPYTIVEKGGVRIAVLGLVTTAITCWINTDLWKGLRFQDMVESANVWVERIKQNEKPDVLVGIFHSGWNDGSVNENETLRVVESIKDFDLVFYGHDHHPAIHRVGKTICINSGSLAMSVAEVDLAVETVNGYRKITDIDANIITMKPLNESCFLSSQNMIKDWLSSFVGQTCRNLDEREAYFGPCAFIDLFQHVQQKATGAQLSLFAPVSYDTVIPSGRITVADVFRLYSHETPIYTMRFSLSEIKGILEKSYSLWINSISTPPTPPTSSTQSTQSTSSTPPSEAGGLLLLDYNLDNGTRLGLKHLSRNMLSLAGMKYTVDITKAVGERITLYPERSDCEFYTVAVNSYHGSGGGNILTEGAGLSAEELRSRILSITPHGLRHYVFQYFRNPETQSTNGVTDCIPEYSPSWSFVPSSLAEQLSRCDRSLLFP